MTFGSSDLRRGKFAVDIVLDDDRAGRAGQAQDQFAGRGGEGGAGGILERRRQHDHLRAGFQSLPERVEVNALRGHLKPDEFRAAFEEKIPQAGVDGFFQRDFHAGTDQSAPEQIDGLLAAVGDENVVGFARQTGAAKQEGAERFVAAGRAQLEQGAQPVAAQNLFTALAEFLYRKKLFRRPGCREIDEAGAGGTHRRGDGRGERAGPVHRFGFPLRGAADEASPPYRTFDQAIALQKLVGGGDGGPVQSKLTSQFPGRRQPVAGQEIAVPDQSLEISP